MKNYTFTTRNVTAGERDAAGAMVLRTVGDVTTELVGMLPAQLADWEWVADGLNTRGIEEEAFRLSLRGWQVVHATAGVVGVMIQGYGSRVHVEWYDSENEDFFAAGWTRNIRNGAAQVVFARQTAGQGLPADVEPEPYVAPAPVRPVWLEEGTQVRYHGSIKELHDETFTVSECVRHDECENWDCEGYALTPLNYWRPVAIHVNPASVTALAAA